MVKPRWLAAGCALLVLGSIALYAPSLGFGFVAYDDLGVLRNHPNLYGQDALGKSLWEIFVGYFPREEPLLIRDVTWAIDARLWGFASTFGYHFGNVLLNAANVALLFLFLVHATRNPRFAAITAGIFATLAIHVEPVCWIMGRKDVLGAFFTLLALLTQSVGLAQTRPARRHLLYALVFILYPLAVLSKFSAITLVLVLAAHRILAPYLDGRLAAASRFDWREVGRTAFALVPHALVGIALYRWYGRQLYEFQVIGGRGPSPLSWQHLKTLAVFVPLSIGQTVAHIVSAAEHSISYLRPNVALPLSRADLLVALGVVLSALALLAFTARRRKDLLFFVAACFFWLLPYFNVEYVGIWVADRYAYLASACVVAFVVKLGLDALKPGRRALASALAVAAIVWCVYGVTTGRGHQSAFRDARSLWSYEVALPAPSLLAFDGLGKSFMQEAEAATNATAKRVALGNVRSVVRAGIERYHTLPWQPAPGYFIAARTEFAGLYALLGRAAQLSGARPEQTIRYLRRSYDIFPSATTALLLAQQLFNQALPANLSLARESLAYCQDYAVRVWSDPSHRGPARGALANYTRSFPALDVDVRAFLAELGR
jgi:hypothetical protein